MILLVVRLAQSESQGPRRHRCARIAEGQPGGDGMRRRDLTAGLLLAAAVGAVRAQERAKQHRIAIVIPAGPVAAISETSSDTVLRRLYQAFFQELRRLGD